MFAFGNSTWDCTRAVAVLRRTDLTLADLAKGVIAGTSVATPAGWCAIETIQAGDIVLSCDHGMQTVVRVDRDVTWTKGVAGDTANYLRQTSATGYGEIRRLVPAERKELISLHFARNGLVGSRLRAAA